MISGRGRSRKLSSAKRRPRARSARVSEAWIWSTAACRFDSSPLIVESGLSDASICAISIRSEPPRPRTIFASFCFATAMREGFTSVAFMLALASTSTTMFRPLVTERDRRGSPSARTSSASSSSCSSSDSSRLSCENSVVASLSRRMRCQMCENGTATGRRLSLRIYKTTTRPPAMPPIASSVESGSPAKIT